MLFFVSLFAWLCFLQCTTRLQPVSQSAIQTASLPAWLEVWQVIKACRAAGACWWLRYYACALRSWRRTQSTLYFAFPPFWWANILARKGVAALPSAAKLTAAAGTLTPFAVLRHEARPTLRYVAFSVVFVN